MSWRSDCIFEIHHLWQSGFSRVYSNSCCSCSFESEILEIGQSSHMMYSNSILNFQEPTPILNVCTKKVWKLIEFTTYLSVKYGGMKYHFKSLWYNATSDWTQVSQTIGESLDLHLFIILLSPKNAVLHEYVVAKGSCIWTAFWNSNRCSDNSQNQNFGIVCCLNWILIGGTVAVMVNHFITWFSLATNFSVSCLVS